MSEPMRLPTGEEIHFFGNWREKEKSGELNAEGKGLQRWLSGEDLPMTPELATSIRAEFARQERYR